jgi:hypothetical protein
VTPVGEAPIRVTGCVPSSFVRGDAAFWAGAAMLGFGFEDR